MPSTHPLSGSSLPDGGNGQPTPGGDFGFDQTADEALHFSGVSDPVEAMKNLADRFKYLTTVAVGGMGMVMLVQETLSGRCVALKVMRPEAAKDKQLAQQFVREAVITARLQHPHIIPVLELGFLHSTHLYYTMHYVDGKPFDKVIGMGDLHRELSVLRSVALAVRHAHTQGLWHRDLKPQNVLVGKFGDAYVTDWGLVSVQPGAKYELNLPQIVVEQGFTLLPDKLMEETSDAITTSGSGRMGTLGYMAPEQFLHNQHTMGAVSDVYAIGVMLFESLTGKHPFFHQKPAGAFDLYQMMLHPPAPQDLGPGVPDVLDRLCRRAMDPDPHQRLCDLSEFADEIDRFFKGEASSASLSLQAFPTAWPVPLTDPAEAPTTVLPATLESTTAGAAADSLQEENTLLKKQVAYQAKMIELLTDTIAKAANLGGGPFFS